MIRSLKNTNLDNEKKEAEKNYYDAMHQYIATRLGRPLDKMSVRITFLATFLLKFCLLKFIYGLKRNKNFVYFTNQPKRFSNLFFVNLRLKKPFQAFRSQFPSTFFKIRSLYNPGNHFLIICFHSLNPCGSHSVMGV